MDDKWEALRRRLAETTSVLPRGRVESAIGLAVRATLPGARLGDMATIHRRGEPLLAEVVGVDGGHALLMPIGVLDGVAADDEVQAHGVPLTVRVSEDLLGRILNGIGIPIDDGPPIEGVARGVNAAPPPPLERKRISEPFLTGIRAIDGLATLGDGQRVGLFAGSGVGKSMLLGSLARGAQADVVVVALVGERGREAGEFARTNLGEQGMRKSVLVVATSDASAVERVRAAHVATAIAEHFRDRGKKVLLLVDSITRFARALREIGLAAGEPPTRRGYPPSAFAQLPRLLERSGQGERGSITAIYAVLVEGGDMDEPVTDEVRGILDGHIVLDRAIAARGRFPAIDVVGSLSRTMEAVTTTQHRDTARRIRQLVADYEARRDLIAIGAYERGADRAVDDAISVMPAIERFLSQGRDEVENFESVLETMKQILLQVGG